MLWLIRQDESGRSAYEPWEMEPIAILQGLTNPKDHEKEYLAILEKENAATRIPGKRVRKHNFVLQEFVDWLVSVKCYTCKAFATVDY